MDEKKCAEVYKRYADDVYKVSIYYLKDENKAKDLVERVFLNMYKNFDDVDLDYILGYLIHEVKSLVQTESEKSLTSEEVKEE